MHVRVNFGPEVASSRIPHDSTYNKGPTFLATVATLVSIALLIFLLRLYTRTRLLHFFGVDDWLILVSVLCAMGTPVTAVSLTRLGFGRDPKTISLEDTLIVGPYLRSYLLLGIFSIGFIKLSVAFSLLRNFQRARYRSMMYAIIGIVILSTLFWGLTLILQCRPIAAAWNPKQRFRARCMSRSTYKDLTLLNSSINLATSLLLATLSYRLAWTLNISSKLKTSLMAMMTLGLLSCVAAIARIPVTSNTSSEYDPLAHGVLSCISSVVEMTIGIIAACLPTLKPLLNTLSTFFSNLNPSRRASATAKHGRPTYSPPPSPYPPSYSTPTFLSLPRPQPTRFHDHTSDLDFDLFGTPAPRAHTHSRNPSALTTLSNFTNFTMRFDGELSRPMSRARTGSKGLSELGEEMKGFKSGYAVSITSGSGETCDGSEDCETIPRVASVEESMGGLPNVINDESTGGILKTTEIKIT